LKRASRNNSRFRLQLFMEIGRKSSMPQRRHRQGGGPRHREEAATLTAAEGILESEQKDAEEEETEVEEVEL
jgi:hypothetical protein